MADSPTLARRRRRRLRRVADDQRQRASRACDYCKSRKSKCIEAAPGACERCLKNQLSCNLDRSSRSPSAHIPHQGGSSVIAGGGRGTPLLAEEPITINSHQADRTMWPRFLSKLREMFYLDCQNTPEAHDMEVMQDTITGIRSLMPAEYQRLRNAVNVFPPRPVADFLSTTCMRHATDLFFYFDQARFIQDLDTFYRDPQSPLRADIGFVGLALAIFALGSQWTPRMRPEPSISPILGQDGHEPGKIFYDQMKSLIPDLIEKSCIKSIQVIFILGVYLMPTNAVGSSYIYLGIALRKALAFDLHQDPDDGSIDEHEKEGRRRLWWSIYCLERVTSIKLNRARSLDLDLVTTPLPTPIPSMDKEQVFDNLELQLAYIKLVKILDRVASIGQGARVTPVAVERFEASLKDWKKCLPPRFRPASMHSRDHDYRARLHLHLNYYYTWIAMGKVSVMKVVRAHLHESLHANTSAPGPVEPVVRDLANSCIKAAGKILRLFEQSKNSGNIVDFSFTDFQGCSIATIVTLLSGILDQDLGFDTRVAFGLECLRTMARGNTYAKLGLRFVEALQNIVNEAVHKLRQAESRRADTIDMEDDGQAVNLGYEKWKHWLAQTGTASGSRITLSPTISQMEASTGLNSSFPQARAADLPGHSQDNTWDQGVAPPLVPPQSEMHQDFLDVGSSLPRSQSNTGFDAMFSVDNSAIYQLPGDSQQFPIGLIGLDYLDFEDITNPL